jgi:hypothetical protein
MCTMPLTLLSPVPGTVGPLTKVNELVVELKIVSAIVTGPPNFSAPLVMSRACSVST